MHEDVQKRSCPANTVSTSTKATAPLLSAKSQKVPAQTNQAASSKDTRQSMFACPRPGCLTYFKTLAALESHSAVKHPDSIAARVVQRRESASKCKESVIKSPKRSLAPPHHPFRCVACHEGCENENELRERWV
ncbi:hypothetical protein GY45DRAFT_6577 [Cubamyces sp. BRFM 1775]|nr:hypothetical protein GY45DRAFT_6577 [Cubamyces sp. BRFM 1775]